MTDMLIKLYQQPLTDRDIRALGKQGVRVRRAMAYEREKILSWITSTFHARWADECNVAFGRQPIGCFIAIKAKTLCGFCCFDCTFRNFVGPIGVQADFRKQGIGRALLSFCLQAMYSQGYAYAIVGNVGASTFFEKTAGAIEIVDSTPGPYPLGLG